MSLLHQYLLGLKQLYWVTFRKDLRPVDGRKSSKRSAVTKFRVSAVSIKPSLQLQYKMFTVRNIYQKNSETRVEQQPR